MNKQLIIKHSQQWELEKEYEKVLARHEQLITTIDYCQQQRHLVNQKKEQLKQQILDWEKTHLGLLSASYFRQNKEGRNE